MSKDFSGAALVKTTTMEKLVGKTVDTILNASPLTLRLLGNQKPWKGSKYKIPVKYVANSQGTSFDGLDKFSTTKTENRENMYFGPTGYEMPCVIDQMEVDVNATAKVTDLVALQLESDAQDMIDDISDMFYTAQTGKAFESLIDAYDDDTLGVTTYGGLDRSAYGLQGNYVNIGGAITLTAMRTQMNATKHGNRKANMIVTTDAVWGYYEKLLTPTVQTNLSQSDSRGYAKMTRTGAVGAGTDLRGQQGFDAIYHSGVPIVADEKCTAGYMFHIRDDDLSFYGLPSTMPGYKPVSFKSDLIEGVYANVPVVTGFSFSGFNTPIDQYGRVGHIILMGNLICKNPRFGGVAVGITS